MKKDLLEYIKVASFVIIAISLSVIAWNCSKEISYLQEIEQQLDYIKQAIYNH
jgi:hypothetical protein